MIGNPFIQAKLNDLIGFLIIKIKVFFISCNFFIVICTSKNNFVSKGDCLQDFLEVLLN